MKLFKNRLFIGAMCLALAIVIAFVAVPLVNNLSSKTIEVVRVNKDVGMGTQLTEDMLEIVEIGDINLPSKPATSINEVKGLFATVDLRAHDVLYETKVTNKLTIPDNKIRKMSAGESAYTILINDSYRSRLLPNDIVTFYTFDEAGNSEVVKELEYVSVVTTTTKDKVDILYASQVGADGKALVPETITFILTKDQVAKLLTLENSGKFKISLIYRGDDETTIDDYLNQQKSYLGNKKVAVTDAANVQK